MEEAGEDVTGSRVGPHTDLEEVTIAGRPAAMEGGEVTTHRIVEMYGERIEVLDRGGPPLRSVLEVNPEALEITNVLDRERRANGHQQKWRGHRPRCVFGRHRSYQLSPGEHDWPLRGRLASLCFCWAISAFRLNALGSVTILTPPPRPRRRTCPRRRRGCEGARSLGNVSQWLASLHRASCYCSWQRSAAPPRNAGSPPSTSAWRASPLELRVPGMKPCPVGK